MSSAEDLIELEAIERLEAAQGYERIVHSHLPEIELTGERSATGRWSLFEYHAPAAGGPADRMHRFAQLSVEYEKVNRHWRIADRTTTPLRDDHAIVAAAAVDPPQSLTRTWLPAGEATTIDDLVDVEAIKQLKARYFRYLDTKDWISWRALFTDDARFDVPSVVSIDTPTDDFVEAVARGMASTRTVHHGHVPDIVLTGADTASGIWALNDYVEMPVPSPQAGGTYGVRGYGHYEERYRRDAGVWKIAHLRLSYLRLDPLLRPAIEQTDLGPAVSDAWLADAPLPDASRLTDLRAIKQLKTRYFGAVDGKRWSEWRSAFTDDAVCSVSGGPDQPVDDFIASGRERITDATTIHHGHMPEIRFTGADTARGIWALFDYGHWPIDGSGYAGYGHYEEEYRRDNGAWQIASMRLRRLRVDPMPAGRPLEGAEDT